LETRYERQISDRWYWYAAMGWDRNEPAGIKNRTVLASGVGNVWFDRAEARFRTDLGLTYTDQEDLVEPVGSGGGFAGLRLSYDYWRQLTTTAEFTSLLTLDQNLDRSNDLRAALANTLAVRISGNLALKLSHELQYDNSPSLIAVPVVSLQGTPVGEDLLVEADDVDSTISLALVVAF
jgi:putative salt-induced outer membrane protein YdiY